MNRCSVDVVVVAKYLVLVLDGGGGCSEEEEKDDNVLIPVVVIVEERDVHGCSVSTRRLRCLHNTEDEQQKHTWIPFPRHKNDGIVPWWVVVEKQHTMIQHPNS